MFILGRILSHVSHFVINEKINIITKNNEISFSTMIMRSLIKLSITSMAHISLSALHSNLIVYLQNQHALL